MSRTAQHTAPQTAQHTRARFVPLVLAVSCLLIAGLLVAPQAAAKPPNPPTARALAAAAPATDVSTQLPRTRNDETVGDFGAGYYQRAVYQNNMINIYEPESRGGGLARSTPTDLTPVGPIGGYGWQFLGGPSNDLAVANNFNSVFLHWTPDALYIAGFTGVGNPCCINVANMLYKVSPDGTCASKSCAIYAKQVPEIVGSPEGNFTDRLIGTTALTVGQVGGNRYIAIGTSEAGYFAANGAEDGGVFIFDDSGLDEWGNFPRPGQWTAYRATGNVNNVVTSLAFDPLGSGLLAVGVSSPGRSMNALWFNPADSCMWRKNCRYTYVDQLNGDDYLPAVLSTAVTNRADGKPIVAFGLSDGSVKLWDPAVTSTTFLASAAGTGTDANPKAVNALTFVERSDGTDGVPDLVAVSSRGDFAQVLRYSGATTLAALPIVKGGTSTDVGGIRAWFPGYKTGRFRIFSRLQEPVQISFSSRPNAAYGCWFAPAFPGRLAFPTGSITMGPTSLTDRFTIGGYTAGENGDCAATDATGQWAAYMVITPTRRPADTTTVKMVISRSGQLSLTTVGGSITTNVLGPGPRQGPLGDWTVQLLGPSAPTPGALKLVATMLDADPDGTGRPVYRFDVPASTWTLPASTPGRIQTVLEPLDVWAAPNIGNSVELGKLVPQGAPSRSTSGTVTLSPVSFYWQQPADGPNLEYFGIASGDVTSNIVHLPDVPAPTPGTTIDQLVVCPATGSSACDGNADPIANGLDQAPLRIQISDATGVLSTAKPEYGRIYYRDSNGDLVTGLIPADGSPYIRVSPYPGAYPNDGSSAGGTRPPVNAPVGGRFGYLSTTTTLEQEITAHVGGSPKTGDPIIVDGTDFIPQVAAGSEAGSGFYVTGCTDYSGYNYCRIANPTSTAPALFLTTDPDNGDLRIGLQFKTLAQTSLSSFPLQQVAGQPEHNVAAQSLSITNGDVHLSTTSGFQPGDNIDTYLVSHGQQIPIRAIKVGGGN